MKGTPIQFLYHVYRYMLVCGMRQLFFVSVLLLLHIELWSLFRSIFFHCLLSGVTGLLSSRFCREIVLTDHNDEVIKASIILSSHPYLFIFPIKPSRTFHSFSAALHNPLHSGTEEKYRCAFFRNVISCR